MHVCNKHTSLEVSLTSKIKKLHSSKYIIEIFAGISFFLIAILFRYTILNTSFEYQISLESNDLLLFS